jgi:redox-sensing transcriptional repressor
MSKLDPIRTTGPNDLKLSRASAGRLSLYLRCLEGFHRDGVTKVSSSQLGEALAVSDAQVRKDLASLGNLGQPGIGYTVPELIGAIRRALGIDREWKAVLVGVGNLARALMRYRGFQQQGFQVVALCDNDPSKVGQMVEELTVLGLEDLPNVVHSTGAEMGILTVPADAAQAVADRLAAAGVRGILNFAPTVLKMPPGVSLVTVDLAIQLEQLAFQIQWSANDR